LVKTNHNGNSGYPGLAWDPIEKAVIGYPNGGNTMYLLSLKTWTCKTETYGTQQGMDYPQDDAPTQGGGTFKHFSYFPDLDLFVLCNDPGNDCWYLRRRAAGVKHEKNNTGVYSVGEKTEQAALRPLTVPRRNSRLSKAVSDSNDMFHVRVQY